MNKLKFPILTIILVMAAAFVAPGPQTAEAADPPSNDNFADAKIIDTMPYQDTVNNVVATTETDEPASGCTYFGIPNYTIWYAYTPAEIGLLIGNNSSNFDSFMGIYTGSSLGGLTQVACTYYGDSFQLPVTPGTTYFIQIGSLYDWSSGDATLYLSLTPPPANDNFADAKIVDMMPYQDTVDNSSATSEPDEPAGCPYSGAVKTIWYAYTPIEKGLLSGNASTNYYSFLTVYTGNSLDNLTQVTCTNWGNTFQISVSPGTTYYIQIGSLYDWSYGVGTLNLSFTPPPPNNDFANALVIGSIPFYATVNNSSASTEDGEPDPGCTWGGISRTLWYSYTPSASGSITFQRGGFYESFIAVYTGSSLNSLTLLRCAGFWQNRFTLPLEAGVTYYIQLGSAYYNFGDLSLDLYVPPPPNANFYRWPGDPSRFDNIQFCDYSYDPVGEVFNNFWWNFGDGAELETGDSCVYHQYPADGDYTVWHKVQTVDGRTGETTQGVSVRTHDVAITKFSVPQTASVGQTRQIVVGIRNNLYPENVTVDLYKSTIYGYDWVGMLNMSVPVRQANRTTDFKFSYTFSNDDGKTGKMTFKAVATRINGRDAYPEDNTAISLPTKVTGYKPPPPYSASVVHPSDATGVASTFGLLALGLASGIVMVRRKKF